MNHSKPYKHNSRCKPGRSSEGNDIDAREACNIIRLPALRKVSDGCMVIWCKYLYASDRSGPSLKQYQRSGVKK